MRKPGTALAVPPEPPFPLRSKLSRMLRTDRPPSLRVALVAPLPPQVGGVTSVAAWLLAHEAEIGCSFESFDLWRPRDAQTGGRFQFRAVFRQLVLTMRFARWVGSTPTTVHYCVTCSVLGLSRDLLFLLIARLSGRRVIAHIHGSEFATSRSAPFFQVPALRL